MFLTTSAYSAIYTLNYEGPEDTLITGTFTTIEDPAPPAPDRFQNTGIIESYAITVGSTGTTYNEGNSTLNSFDLYWAPSYNNWSFSLTATDFSGDGLGSTGSSGNASDWATGSTGGSGPGSWSVVPIPGAVWLLGSGLVGLVGLRRKFQK